MLRELVRCAGFVLAVLAAVAAFALLRELVATQAAHLPVTGLGVAFVGALVLASGGVAVAGLVRRGVS